MSYLVDKIHQTTKIIDLDPLIRSEFAWNSLLWLNHPLNASGGWAENLKIIENGREVSYLIGKIHQTTKIIDLDPS